MRYISRIAQVRSIASDTLQIEDIYDVGELLGSGVAGEVHVAVHRETSAPSIVSITLYVLHSAVFTLCVVLDSAKGGHQIYF